jgi:hypothetical protein
MQGETCVLCHPSGTRLYAEAVIDDVPLCATHARVVAMKRLGVTEADLQTSSSEQDDQEAGR